MPDPAPTTTAPDGTASDGTSPDAIPAKGTAPDGTTPQDTTADATSPADPDPVDVSSDDSGAEKSQVSTNSSTADEGPDHVSSIDLDPAGPNAINLGFTSAASDNEAATDQKPKTRGRVRRVLIAILLAVAIAGMTALAFASWRIIAQRHALLEIQPQVGPLSLDYSSEGAVTADYLRTALAAEVELDTTVGAVYRESPEKSVLFLGGTGLIWTPAKDLDTAMDLISDNEGSVTDLHEVDPGPLSGTMKCGVTKASDGDLTVCGWADHGSLALALFNNRPPAEAAPLMLEMRNITESR
ncbi:MAG TPA: hypothetical protein VFG35_22455 [Actinoplanes sp.]|nr:hypothetical protein [Actinoplanes sp.]